jgi:hypothetical protein
VTIVVTSVLAMKGFSFVSAVIANQPTPWMDDSTTSHCQPADLEI